jgi:TRAP-type C4-dicarboxylate transport system permease small subunit
LASFEILIPQAWVLFFTLPLVFSGISLAHAVCEKRRLPSLALVMFYVLLLLPITVQIIVFLALIDSWYDFRKKLERDS